jgi:hypothetical protein
LSIHVSLLDEEDAPAADAVLPCELK